MQLIRDRLGNTRRSIFLNALDMLLNSLISLIIFCVIMISPLQRRLRTRRPSRAEREMPRRRLAACQAPPPSASTHPLPLSIYPFLLDTSASPALVTSRCHLFFPFPRLSHFPVLSHHLARERGKLREHCLPNDHSPHSFHLYSHECFFSAYFPPFSLSLFTCFTPLVRVLVNPLVPAAEFREQHKNTLKKISFSINTECLYFCLF